MVDQIGNVYTTGMFVSTVDFDPGPSTFNLTSAGDRDVFVNKLDSAGNFVWAGQLGGSSEDFGIGIAVAGGKIYTTGYFSGTADFDPGAGTHTLTSAGGRDIFVSQLLELPDTGEYNVTVTAGASIRGIDFGNVENQSPTAVNDSGIATNEDTPLMIGESVLTGNDNDPDLDVLHVVGVSPTSTQGGTVSLWQPTATSPADDPAAGGFCGTAIVDMIATADGDLITGHYSQRYRSSDLGDTWQIIYQAGANCQSSANYNRADDGRIFYIQSNATGTVVGDNFTTTVASVAVGDPAYYSLGTGVNYGTGDGLFLGHQRSWESWRYNDLEGFVMFYDNDDASGKPYIRSALGDRDGFIWIQTSDGKLQRSTVPADPGTGLLTFAQVGAADGLLTPQIVSRDGAIYVTDASGDLWRSVNDGSSFTEVALRASFTGTGIALRDIVELASGALMIGMDNGEIRQSLDRGVTWFVTGRLDSPVKALTEATPGHVFAATADTVYEFNQTSVHLAYDPVQNFFGTDTFTYTVSDLNGGVSTAVVTVTVNAVNDAPTLDDPADPPTLNESASQQTVSLSGISTGGGETQVLAITATSNNQTLLPDGNITIEYTSANPTGTLRFTPAANTFGTAVVTVTVSDEGLDGDIFQTADNGTFSQQFTVEVNEDAEIRGVKFHDLNENGVQDNGEPGTSRLDDLHRRQQQWCG